MTMSVPSAFGPYRVLELIERIGGTNIYLARQTTIDRLVTLTVLPPQSTTDAAFTKRFQRQVLAASRLSHPNVVRAIDAGAIDGHQYIAAEYAGGSRLAAALEKNEWFPIRRCLRIGLHIARALAHLESKDLVHRGLTPRAVVLAESGVAKLRSFSLSKFQEGDGSQTWFDVDPYAAQYMAPELVRFAEDIDTRADIYALGCVLYHVVTGEPPFKGATAAAIMKQHAQKPVPGAHRLRDDLPESFGAVIGLCVAQDPAQRYQTAQALVEDLEALQGGATLRRQAQKPSRLRWLTALFRNPE